MRSRPTKKSSIADLANAATRRDVLKVLAKAAGYGLASGLPLGCSGAGASFGLTKHMGRHASFAAADGSQPRFLIVLTCSGGASILDSFMALSEGEVTAAGGNSGTINCFSDAQMVAVPNTDLRALKIDATIPNLGNFKFSADQSNFLRKHAADTMIVTTEGTSVNHDVAQKRSLTGNEAWRGRTIQECVAAQYGSKLPLANLMMGAGGFAEAGIDQTLPEWGKQVSVSDPLYWPLGLHGSLGLSTPVNAELLASARELRAKKLEPESRFFRTFKDSGAVKRWLDQRDETLPAFEQSELIKKLLFLPDSTADLAASPDTQKLRELFPNYKKDPLDAQAIMAYLALTKGASCSVTLGPSPSSVSDGIQNWYNAPIAFDFSHTDHRGTQALMWLRVLSVADRLIDLLKGTELPGAGGKSFWDHTVIYFATEFGRDKTRPSGAIDFSTGHHLNNASVIVSPMAKGNSILGGVNPATGLTYGFNIADGSPDKNRKTSEREFFAGLAGILGLDVASVGLPDVRAMRKV